MKIRNKILALVGLAILGLAAVGALAQLELARLNGSLQNLASSSLPQVITIGDIRATFHSVRGNVYQYIITNSKDRRTEIAADIKAKRERLAKALGRYKHSANGTDVDQVTKTENDLRTLNAALDNVLSFADQGDTHTALISMGGECERASSQVDEDLGKLNELAVQHAAGTVASSRISYQAAVRISLAVAGAATLMMLAMGWLLGRSILSRMLGVRNLIVMTATHLDFSQRVPSESKDEVGDALLAYNQLLEHLQASFRQVQESIENISSVTHEVAGQAKNIASRSERQNGAAVNMAESVAQMAVGVQQVAASAAEANRHASLSGQVARESSEVILSAVDSINGIHGAVDGVSARIAEMGRNSESIASVVSVIRDIADQINLLALNAAIEAARAGEHGRGFAVVADEVRRLSERTALSTAEITELVNKIDADTQAADKGMHHTVVLVGEGVAKANAASQAIRQILEAAENIHGVVTNISAAIEQQKISSEEMAKRVEQVALMSEENAALATLASDGTLMLAAKTEKIQSDIAKYRC